MKNVILVEDEFIIREYIKSLLSELDLNFIEFQDPDNLRNYLDDQYTQHQNLNDDYIAIVDMHLGVSKNQGIIALESLKKYKIDSIVLSSQEEEYLIEKAYELGCKLFLSKRCLKSDLVPYFKRILSKLSHNTAQELTKLFSTRDERLKNNIITTVSAKWINQALFIQGETGTGKSKLARVLHEMRFGSDKVFYHVSCADFTDTLLASELFGHKKGAFTGASSDKIGILQKVDGGTLFLDEIGTMSSKMQNMLLRVLETKEFLPVGETQRSIRSDFSLICATWEDLYHHDQFRKDLFFRIAGTQITLPPLRDRVCDITLYIDEYLKKSPKKMIIKNDVIDRIKSLELRGNYRELEFILTSFLNSDRGVIDLDFYEQWRIHQVKSHSVNDGSITTRAKKENATKLQAEALDMSLIYEIGIKEYLEKLEIQIVQDELKKQNHNVTSTIKKLGLSNARFYKLKEKFSI